VESWGWFGNPEEREQLPSESVTIRMQKIWLTEKTVRATMNCGLCRSLMLLLLAVTVMGTHGSIVG
jgi:hypothetical protein